MFYKLGINPRLWLDLKEDSAIALSSDFRGALAENSVMQAFSGNSLQTYYWVPPSSWKTTGELDFLLQTDRMEIVPVEVSPHATCAREPSGRSWTKPDRHMPTFCPRTIFSAAKPMTARATPPPLVRSGLYWSKLPQEQSVSPARPPRKETAHATHTVYLPWQHLSIDDVTADYQAY